MPKVRYTYKEDGDPASFSEEDILPPGMNIDLRAKQQVMVWNEEAEKTGEPMRELVKVEVIDAFIHEHVWIVRISRKTTGRVEYMYCQHCKCTGTRVLDGHVTLDEKWNSSHNDYCHEKKPVLKRPIFK